MALPSPWRRLGTTIVGGLTAVGFAETDEGEYLLVLSHDGRGVFDAAGAKVARDPAYENEREWHDIQRLTALGIGPIEGIPVRVAGVWGGGLSRHTRDHWRVEINSRVVLLTPRRQREFELTDGEVRAAGFSPSGKTLVVATTADVTFYGRPSR